MIPVTQYNTQAVAVLGLGRSGLSAARALKAGGATPICWDDNTDSLSAAEAEGFLIANLHAEQTWQEHDFAALILSPGIPHLYPKPNPVVKLAWQYGVPVDNDVSLFFGVLLDLWADDYGEVKFEEEEEPVVVCITGSNGKSTTTALITHILEQAGRPVQMGGNIGRGVLDLEPPRKNEIYVLELSSYQTELASDLSPNIAVFLNFSPDHFDRHGGRGGYFAAKTRLFDREETLEGVVVGINEDEGRYLANHLLSNQEVAVLVKDRTGGQGFEHALFVENNALIEHIADEGERSLMLPANPALLGDHNQQNMAAASAVCRMLGLADEELESALQTFPGLPHRMEQVGALGKVSFVNDSKATNVDAATKSLGAFKNIYWIAGGQAKEGGLDELKETIPNIKKAFLIGEGASVFAQLLGEALPFEMSGTLEKALEQAASEAAALGEEAVVLLAPACASFDQFKSFEHRGDAFRAQALAILNKGQ
ncbi:MAG: UDP-N-acetylmuramoyl-L-alanine--D-glutamate ligase [Hyphomicrobiaceae bacterium]|nr:UDP-N-acetylmuramoyl-L-alanine--D-glutamate ligase [Hyphomicrobiaceae bacterium]